MTKINEDGVALTSIAHPEKNAGHVPASLTPLSLVTQEITITVDGNLIVPKQFILFIRRPIPRHRFLENPVIADALAIEMYETLDLFNTLFPVYKWRTEPEFASEHDFAADIQWLQIYARGFLDMPARLSEQTTWWIEA